MRFERPEIIRPPSEWRSYYLPLTAGCSNNTCTFCNFHGCKLQVREVEDVKREIDAVALYVRGGVTVPGTPRIVYAIAREWDGKGLFLQDGDALVYPFPKLKEALEYLDERLPHIERVAAYATASDILRKTPRELEELRKLKLGILYMGLESGDDDILRRTEKGATTAEMIEAGRKAIAAGITLSVTVLLGLGGVGGSEKHALETARVLSRIDPEYVGALTLTLVPGTPLHRDWEEGRFTPISPFQSLAELRLMVENASFTHCFFSSMHASNYLALRGWLPRDKAGMLAELDNVLARRDESLLRPEYFRGL